MYVKQLKWLSKTIFITSVSINLANSANNNFCKQYAQNAINQFYLAQATKLSNINPPTWSNDYVRHKKWCESNFTTETVANKEASKRQQHLNHSLKKAKYIGKFKPNIQNNCNVKKTIQSDGSVQISYPDGRIKTISSEKTIIKYPDGRVEEKPKIVFYTNVPSANPPASPSTNTEALWLNHHASKLLDIIHIQLQDKNSFEEYKEFEGNELSVFDLIDKRSQIIDYLISP